MEKEMENGKWVEGKAIFLLHVLSEISQQTKSTY